MPQEFSNLVKVFSFMPDRTFANEKFEFAGNRCGLLTAFYPIPPIYVLAGHLQLAFDAPVRGFDSTPPLSRYYDNLPLLPRVIYRHEFYRAFFSFLPSTSVTQTEFDFVLNRSLTDAVQIFFGRDVEPISGGLAAGIFRIVYSGDVPTNAGTATILFPTPAYCTGARVIIRSGAILNPITYTITDASSLGSITLFGGALPVSGSPEIVTHDISGGYDGSLQVDLAGGGAGEISSLGVEVIYYE